MIQGDTLLMLPTASYNLPSRNAGRLVNCYAIPSQTKGRIEIKGLPGIASVSVPSGAGRGLVVMGGRLYVVTGQTLYGLVEGQVGSIPGDGKLSFAVGEGYFATDNNVYFNGSALTSITDADKPRTSTVDYVDGYMVGVEADSGRFVSSALRDFTSWDGLDFATAEGAPDDLVTLKVDHRQVVLFGNDSTEVWWNSGASGFPFERIANGFIEIGCLAKRGVTKADNSVFWLASDRTIRRLSGATPVKVSQLGVEERLAAYNTVSDCIAFSFTWQGQVLVWFRFPTENESWVFNVSTGEWFESDLALIDAVQFDGMTYVQHEDGRVGFFSVSLHTKFGEESRYLVRFPNVYSGHARQFFSQLDIVLRSGEVPQNAEAYSTLRVSHDGGNTFFTLPIKSFGLTGEYRHVLRWNRLGSGRDTVFEWSAAGNFPLHLTDSVLVAQAGGL